MSSTRGAGCALWAILGSAAVCACARHAGLREQPPPPQPASSDATLPASAEASASSDAPAWAAGPASASASAAPGMPPTHQPRPRATAQVLADWPCAGCSTRLPPTDDAGRPAPMLVVLHGDDGNTGWMDWIWRTATDRQGVVMLVLRCPFAGGYGAPRWTVWQKSAGHDVAWLQARVAQVASKQPIDAQRIYASGYSSGASYLSWHLANRPGTFAAVSLVAGGIKPASGCGTDKTPVHVLAGALDTMLKPDLEPLRDWYRGCGHEVGWDVREGMTHEGILWVVERGGADEILKWMIAAASKRRAP